MRTPINSIFPDSMLKKLSALSTRVGEFGDDQLVTMLTKEDVARIFVVCARTVERWVEQGMLPAYKFGTHRSAAIRFKVEDVDQLLLSRLRDAKETKAISDESSSSHPATCPPCPQGG